MTKSEHHEWMTEYFESRRIKIKGDETFQKFLDDLWNIAEARDAVYLIRKEFNERTEKIFSVIMGEVLMKMTGSIN